MRLFAPALARSPGGFSSLLAALDETLVPPTTVLLAGDRDTCVAWQRALERRLRPAVRIFNVAGIALAPELVKGPAPAGDAVAWVCRGTQCLPPIASLPEVERTLAE